MNRGLVLSGGGFRGIAHIGAIKALEEYDLVPSHVAGTSSGAIVGALYAAGCEWEEILDFFKTVNLFSINNYARRKPGFVDTNKFYDQFKRFFPENDFEALQKKLFITTTNILDGTLEIFSRGEIVLPVLASAAFPGVFTPVQIGNAHYIDGGTLNNFPVDVLRLYCDQIIGVYVNPFEKVKIKDLKHSYNVLERAYQIRSAKDSLAKFKDCDLVISPAGLHKYRTFSLKNLDKVFNMGYQAALTALKSEHGLSLHSKSMSPEIIT